ncbi:alpha/beta fold hydrolase [Deinococcus pimensis]|uniref:alpha/beta fold hydrolase n=1 Tax=Deinococcus pimensis TaxID=309888 RepID=UPI0004B09787|nr:alpha/beta fold hydrolase [Deinococcus pimensis]
MNPPEPPDDALPKGIGAPATRAFHAAGITRLSDLTRHTEAALLALHGVGPKALRVLRDALDARGLTFAGTAERGQVVRIDDLDLYYEEYGSGEPLVLLHGFGGCVQNWHPFVEAFSAAYRLILVDLPGHGFSTNPARTFTHRQAARDVLLLLDRLNVTRFCAMGMSTGGMTLLHMATLQPERVDVMVLISATPTFPDQARTIMRRASFRTMPADVVDMYRACAPRGDAQIRWLIEAFNALGDDRDDMNFSGRELSRVTARTLVVHGDRDHFFPVEMPVRLYQGIPEASLWIVPDGGHVPIHDPAVGFATTALRFLQAPWGDSTGAT